MGSIGILNVGCGDMKLTFDKNNPAECIRAARIVKDMLRRGYALMCDSGKRDPKDDSVIYTRVKEFDEATCEYIIADYDPLTFLAEQPSGPTERIQTDEPAAEAPGTETRAKGPRRGGGWKESPKKRLGTRRIHAADTKTIAVSRSAGG